MKADFSYNNAASGALNSDPDATGSVIGIFSSSIGTLEFDESLLSEGVNGARAPRMRTGSLTLEMISTNLQDGDSYYYAVSDDSALATQYMYFALSGIPDQGGPRTYQPVGAITINISPATLVTKKTK